MTWTSAHDRRLRRRRTRDGLNRARGPNVKLPEQPSLEDLERLALGLVVLIERTDRMLRFRARDPGVYPAYAAFDLVFHAPATFVGDLEMDDVRLRIADAPSGTEPYTHHCLYEFVGNEVVPTDGRPYQVSVLPSGDTETLFGARVTHVKARITARALSIELASEN